MRVFRMNQMFGASSGVSLARSLTASNITTPTNPTALSFYNGIADQPFSISGDVKIITIGSYEYVFTIGNGSFNNYLAFIDPTGKFAMQLADILGNNTQHTTNSGLTTGVWHRLVATFSVANQVILYVDGSTVAKTITGSGYTHMQAIDNTWKGSVAPVDALVRFDNVTIYNKELSQAEVTALQAAVGGDPQLVPAITASIQACWKFNNNVNDSGPNGYNLIGTPTYSTDVPT